nr:exodeoxyribonuclease VII large subunit [uncultured Anaerobutyricum sp.]
MKHIFSVTQINSYIHRIFESDYALKKIYLKGEVSNCKYHSSGHIYFTLKDEKSTLRCVMFSSDRFKGLAFHLEDGQLIEACGNISVYEQAGTYQLYVRKIELAGAGELYVRYERLKQELAEKGYFDFERKKPLPAYPEKIGIVTALTGAAIEDIRSIARRRNQTVQLYLYPAKVQGEGASAEIARGIRYFDKAGVDIIIIGRGGGSIEDLWAFNEMPVADAIYEADTPIISGTGHEVDMTIADYCADVRAATPSAACELAIPDMQSIFTKLSNYREALDMQAEQRCAQLRQQMILLQRQLEAGRPDRKLLKHKLLYERLENRLSQAIKEKYRSRQQMFSRYVDQLSGLAPTNRLKGGYAFAQTKEGRPVASIEHLEKEVPFFLTFSDGEAEVIPVHLKKNKK